MLSKIMRQLRENPLIWAMTALTLAIHMAYAGGYDIFRNELYYIACGRHPAFGYADQPPLVPLIAAFTQIFGINAWLLRFPAAFAAAALVPITASFTRLLGGNSGSAIAAAGAAAIAPALIGLTQILTTSSFEPLGWTLCAYLLTRAVLHQDRRAWLGAGITAGISMQAKYGIDLWLIGLCAGLLLTPYRTQLFTRNCRDGLLIAFAIALPSVIWQSIYGWPFVQVMMHHTVGHTNYTGTPLVYEIVQIFALNPLLAPLWLTGLIAPFLMRRLQPARFLAIAYIVTAALIILLRGKDYYLFPAYPALFAAGAAACAGLSKWFGVPWAILATANSAFIAPIVLPILDPPALADFMDHYHIHPRPDEAAAVGAPLTQVFSDEMGWRELEQKVAAIYHALPPGDQRRAAIIGSNYGEAAAIDIYGRADHLPPALSGQDQYFIWGPRGYDGSVVIHINGDPEHWRKNCASLDIAGYFGAPYAMPYENDRPIFICRGLRVPLDEAWPLFKRMQ